jgi:type I restriction enzyme S subunit
MINKLSKQEWIKTTLGEVLTFQRGFDILKKELQSGDYDVIFSSGYGGKHNLYKVKAPGVVIGRKGTLGKVFFVTTNFWPTDTTLWVKNFHGNNEKFAYYFLQTLYLEQYDCGAANPTLNRNHIHTLPVTYPSLPTQQKIAAILSNYDDLIENNTRRIKILEEMAQTLYHEWFVKFRFPGHEQVKMVESELGLIPEGWEVKKLGDISEITSSKRIYAGDYVSEGIPFYRQKEIIKLYHNESLNSEVLYISNEKFNQIKTKFGVPQENDILITSVGTLGIPYLVKGDDCFYFKDGNLIWFRNNETSIAHYLYHWLDSENGQNSLFQTTIGTSQKAFTIINIKSIKIVIPTQKLLHHFGQVIIPIHQQKNMLFRKNINLRATRDLLLPKLISGEIDVENLEIDTGKIAA